MITRREAAIIGAYTGYTLGPFSDIHALAEELIGRPLWTHQFAGVTLTKELQDKARPLFVALQIEGVNLGQTDGGCDDLIR